VDSGRCSGFWGDGVAGRRGGRNVGDGPWERGVGCGLWDRPGGKVLAAVFTYCSTIDKIQFVDEVFSEGDGMNYSMFVGFRSQWEYTLQYTLR